MRGGTYSLIRFAGGNPMEGIPPLFSEERTVKVTRALSIFAGVALLVTVFAMTRSPSSSPSSVIGRGKLIYEQKCAICHGPEGKGDGPAALYTYPKPRDFTKGLFKIRSTPSGTLPTGDDLLRTVTDGMPGTAMPSFTTLPEDDRRAVVEYVKVLYLNERKQVRQTEEVRWVPGTPVKVGEVPKVTPQTIAEGKRLYEDMGCSACHGPLGRGDGPSAQGLKDEWGFPITVRDFTSGVYKGGPRDRDLYLRFTTGMSGTPMPSFGDVLTDRQRWALVHYVQSLRRAEVKRVIAPRDGVIESIATASPLPKEDPKAAVWTQAPAFEIPLNPLWQRAQAPAYLRVKSLHHERDIAFLLEWEDPIVDDRFIKPEDFRDAAAIQFSLTEQEPSLTMGDAKGEVNLWHWKADWQADLERFAEIQTAHPAMHSDVYIAEKGIGNGVLFATGRAAGNLFSMPERNSPIEDVNAKGFGTLESQKAADQNVSGKGLWADGHWSVVFVRSMRSTRGKDVQFIAGKLIPVAFAIWDGSQGDRNGQKVVSTWYRLRVEE